MKNRFLRSASASDSSPVASAAFSLVEVTIAIGIFAFIIVAILGLFPVALSQRSDAALETRAVLIAQQIFGGIPGYSLTNALSSDNMSGGSNAPPTFKNLAGGVVLGFSDRGTSINHIFSDTNSWANADVGPVSQTITMKAFVSSSNVSPGLYLVNVQVGYPAYLPADKRRVQSFSTFVRSP